MLQQISNLGYLQNSTKRKFLGVKPNHNTRRQGPKDPIFHMHHLLIPTVKARANKFARIS